MARLVGAGGLVGVLFALGMSASCAQQLSASAEIKNAEGESVGTVTLESVDRGTLVHAVFDGLAPGTHGFHVHTTGQCAPSFDAAGGHFNPAGGTHGFKSQNGPHAGDLPNIFVPESGALEIEFYSTGLTLDDSLFDADGAAIVVHAGPDDYATDPSGDSGARIACGVLQR